MSGTDRTLIWALRGGFVLAAALALFFGIRVTVSAFYWNNPDNLDRPIEGWMPLGYVARSWQVPPEVLGAVLGIEQGSMPRRTLDRIARETGVPAEVLIARIAEAIASHRGAADD